MHEIITGVSEDLSIITVLSVQTIDLKKNAYVRLMLKYCKFYLDQNTKITYKCKQFIYHTDSVSVEYRRG